MTKQKLLGTALALMISLTLATGAEAKCNGGTLVKGVNNSYDYCVSDITMTWWAAFSWCEAQGRKLATWEEACPGVSRGATCTNMNHNAHAEIEFPSKFKDKYGWVALPSGDKNAYYVNLSSGDVSGYSFRNNYNFALCK